MARQTHAPIPAHAAANGHGTPVRRDGVRAPLSRFWYAGTLLKPTAAELTASPAQHSGAEPTELPTGR